MYVDALLSGGHLNYCPFSNIAHCHTNTVVGIRPSFFLSRAKRPRYPESTLAGSQTFALHAQQMSFAYLLHTRESARNYLHARSQSEFPLTFIQCFNT